MTGGRVAGKTALITGAAGGLGQAMARMLVREGAKVALSDLDLNGARALAEAINAEHPGMAFAYEHDVTREDDWVRVVGAAVEDMGGLSILVNNAGIGGQLLWAEQDTLENWRRVQAINLESVMLGCKHAMAPLRASGAGSIVNISSIAGLAAAPGMGAYNATKAAVWLYTKTVALEVAEFGVTCNCISPGYVWTPLVENQIPDTMKARNMTREQVMNDVLLAGQPTKQFVTAEQVAATALYLCSDAAAQITGANLSIDGGWTAQ